MPKIAGERASDLGESNPFSTSPTPLDQASEPKQRQEPIGRRLFEENHVSKRELQFLPTLSGISHDDPAAPAISKLGLSLQALPQAAHLSQSNLNDRPSSPYKS
jgi:hypothetical protein